MAFVVWGWQLWLKERQENLVSVWIQIEDNNNMTKHVTSEYFPPKYPDLLSRSLCPPPRLSESEPSPSPWPRSSSSLAPRRNSSGSSVSGLGPTHYTSQSFLVKLLTSLTWSTLISWRARDKPCLTSVHWSVSSLRTSLVTRGVAGTTSYCCKENTDGSVKTK